MKVKKLALLLVIVAGFGITFSYQVHAREWGGGGYGMYEGCGPSYQALDDATKAKVDAFRSETSGLRRQIAMKTAEKHALLSGQDPNPVEVAKVEGELFDLRTELRSKASAAGVPFMGMGHHGMRGGTKGGRLTN